MRHCRKGQRKHGESCSRAFFIHYHVLRLNSHKVMAGIDTQKRRQPGSRKPRMRTALDVIKRIKWDDDLPEEAFTIGYLDRFVGIKEDPFQKFSHWCDLASADSEDSAVLAIPQHRIQYFKYKDTKVWDKPSRTDLIFGSTLPDRQYGEATSCGQFLNYFVWFQYILMKMCIYENISNRVGFTEKCIKTISGVTFRRTFFILHLLPSYQLFCG